MKNQYFTFVFLVIILVACGQKGQTKINPNKDSTIVVEDNSEAKYRDSLKSAKVDTSTIPGKVQFMINQVNADLFETHIEHDTLFDFNYDGYDDLFLRYYGASGTWLKYNTIVCPFNPKGNYFYTNDDLRFPNASFFIPKKKFTCFYGGDATEYHWQNGKWKEYLSAEYDKEKDEWLVIYIDGKKSKVVKNEKGMDPPTSVIEVNLFYH